MARSYTTCICPHCGTEFRRYTPAVKKINFCKIACAYSYRRGRARTPQKLKLDLTDQVFGRLTVIECVGARRHGRFWKCLCECGNYKEYTTGALRSGHVQSCGCTTRSRTHGMFGTPEYAAWAGIKGRCLNQNDPAYKNYGGRGIAMCERWADSFENFYADMGPRPSNKHSIDRINNDGNYEPSNCRWATKKEQSRNTRKNHLIAFNGEVLCVAEWADKLGIHPHVLWRRLAKFSIEEIASSDEVKNPIYLTGGDQR